METVFGFKKKRDSIASRFTLAIPSRQLSASTTIQPEPEPKSDLQREDYIASKLAMLDCSDSLVFLFTQIAHMPRFTFVLLAEQIN
jgi:hypothetical protein